MKETYYLPWSCKTSDKIKQILSWICLISLPIIAISGIIINNFLMAYLGIMISLISWLFVWITEFVKFPEIKCKPDDIDAQRSRS